MKKLIFIFVAVMGIMFTACNNNEIIVPEEILQSTDNNISEISTNYLVPIDDALAELNAVLASIDNQPQNAMGRSMAPRKQRTIGSIETLAVANNANSTLRRAPGGAVATDTLLYLVNFADEEGYAVLAADARISTPVLAIVESGSISATSFDETPELYDSRIDYGYDELKNFNLHAGGNDYYVSNSMIESSINTMLIDHAMREVSAQIRWLKGPCEPAPPGTYNGNDDFGNTLGTIGTWNDIKKVGPMLTTLWGQTYPFNNDCPGTGPAGCVAIAVAQIAAYHEYPDSLTCYETTIDWKGVKKIYSIYDIINKQPLSLGTAANRNGVANLVRRIGTWCYMLYSQEWAFALPSSARRCMSDNLTYPNAVLHIDYDESKVVDMLDKGNPVFTAAISGIVGGHAWVIDGYIKQRNTIINSSNPERLLLHCNWGWYGKCNGYYESGIFNTKKGAVKTESYEKDGDTSKYNYTWLFHIITHDNPNK